MQEIIFNQDNKSKIRFEDVIKDESMIYCSKEDDEFFFLTKTLDSDNYYWRSLRLVVKTVHNSFNEALRFANKNFDNVMIFKSQLELFEYVNKHLS